MDRRKFLQGTAALFCAPAIVTGVMRLHVPNTEIVIPDWAGEMTATEVRYRLEKYRREMALSYPRHGEHFHNYVTFGYAEITL